MAIAAYIGYWLKGYFEEKPTQADWSVKEVILYDNAGNERRTPARMETLQGGNRPGWNSFHTRTEIPFHARLDHTGNVSMMTDAPPDRGGLPFIETSSYNPGGGTRTPRFVDICPVQEGAE
jgi:hypothetical protein